MDSTNFLFSGPAFGFYGAIIGGLATYLTGTHSKPTDQKLADNAELVTILTGYKDLVGDLQKTVEALTVKVTHQESIISSLRGQVQEMSDKLVDQANEIHGLTSQLKRERAIKNNIMKAKP